MATIRLSMCVLIVSLFSAKGIAQESYKPSPENLRNREWFESARFGLFIHWGVYSVLGDGEWVMNSQKIPIRQYEKLPSLTLRRSTRKPGFSSRKTPG
jgi:Alpha-L-fucosidase.